MSIRRGRGLHLASWLCLIVLALSLGGCSPTKATGQTTQILDSYLPKDWTALTDKPQVRGFQQVNLDGDADPEWLYFFHYDNQPAGAGPVGGIIYDAQQTVVAEQPAAYFVPYRLLPDWRAGKGQGYLGDVTVSWSQAKIDIKSADALADELVVLGSGVGGLTTRVSLFRWLSREQGYGVVHFVGNAGLLLLPADRADAALIREVLVFNHLNDRSHLCEQILHTRQGDALAFSSGAPTIVFCPAAAGTSPGVPGQPAYPEAVVMAWLLGGQSEMLVMPGQNSALQAQLDGELRRVVTINYQGDVPVAGNDGIVSQLSVVTQLETAAGQRTVQWNLVELRSSDTERTSRWRIQSAQRLP